MLLCMSILLVTSNFAPLGLLSLPSIILLSPVEEMLVLELVFVDNMMNGTAHHQQLSDFNSFILAARVTFLNEPGNELLSNKAARISSEAPCVASDEIALAFDISLDSVQ
eukprot:TRINITY_DN9042_c0_g1_i1.p2 TRINITY_DN9042_c0_g1~~TRINITY_DN9042_c0_g1_i1.p2  ORF type:complete len:110 (-),score=20.83 TRINITY_DN9042_c0_g1_i1:363-692(-)